MTDDRALDKPGALKTWWVAVRPFSLTASTMPVVFGTVLAVTVGEASFSPLAFAGAFFGMVFLHAGANLLNDIYDYKKGVDVRVNPVSGAVVRGWITPRRAAMGAAVLFALGAALGLLLFAVVGAPILVVGLVGVAVGVLYSLGPLGLKYNALGDLAVFLNFGVLGSLGAWAVQTGALSWIPAVWAVPMSLLVIGILHANNWRDIEGDRSKGVRTVANLVGDRGSLVYYGLLLFGPFVAVLGIMAVSWTVGPGPRMPLTFLVTFLALPLAVRLMKKGRARHTSKDPLEFLALDGATAQLNMVFGLLCTAALGLDSLVTCCTAVPS